MSWANLDLNQSLIYFESMKNVIGTERKTQNQLQKMYEKKVLESPVIQEMKAENKEIKTTRSAPEIKEIKTGVKIDADATIIGSMTGTGPGYSWSNAPERLVTAAEQLTIPLIVGQRILRATTPAGILISLGLGIYKTVDAYA